VTKEDEARVWEWKETESQNNRRYKSGKEMDSWNEGDIGCVEREYTRNRVDEEAEEGLTNKDEWGIIPNNDIKRDPYPPRTIYERW
jgi:hypothetical protein